MIAAENLFKSLPAPHDFDHQSATVGMAFFLIDDVAFFSGMEHLVLAISANFQLLAKASAEIPPS